MQGELQEISARQMKIEEDLRRKTEELRQEIMENEKGLLKEADKALADAGRTRIATKKIHETIPAKTLRSNEVQAELLALERKEAELGGASVDIEQRIEELRGLTVAAEASVQEYENVVNMLPEGPEKAAAMQRLAEAR